MLLCHKTLRWVDNIPPSVLLLPTNFLKWFSLLKCLTLHEIELSTLFVWKFYVNWLVMVTCGCFNSFLMIVRVGTNMLRWFLVEMRKRTYVEFNEAFFQCLQNSLSYKSWIVNELLWTWYLMLLFKNIGLDK